MGLVASCSPEPKTMRLRQPPQVRVAQTRRLRAAVRAVTQRSRQCLRPVRHQRSGAEQADPPLTKARSAALPACSDGFDNVDGGPECGVYIQMRSIEQVRI